MRCYSCGSEAPWRLVETDCPDPEAPGEYLRFTVCAECDYGINEHTEGECTCNA